MKTHDPKKGPQKRVEKVPLAQSQLLKSAQQLDSTRETARLAREAERCARQAETQALLAKRALARAKEVLARADEEARKFGASLIRTAARREAHEWGNTFSVDEEDRFFAATAAGSFSARTGNVCGLRGENY